MARALAVGAAGALAAGALSGCESTTAKAEKIAAKGTAAFEAKGVQVGRVDRDVQVVGTHVVHDANGTAVVVDLRNRGRRAIGAVPVALTVTGAGGKALWRNDAPGLQDALVRVPELPPGKRVAWVNDQVLAVGAPKAAKARVGRGGPARDVPEVVASSPRLEGDAGTVTARGTVQNRSREDLRELVVAGVARDGDRVVAAGRSIVPRLRPGASAPYAIYFIGDPRRGSLRVQATPFPTPAGRR
jgi:hypothetical protein